MTLLHIQEPAAARPVAPSWAAFLELGFRPLYLAGSAWAIVGVAWWVFAPHTIPSMLPALLWHMHEMLWGFVATIAVGFLLTAGHNWTGITPLKGRLLAALAALWLAARLTLLAPAQPALWVSAALDAAFFGWGALALGRSVVLARNWRNAGLPVMLLALGAGSVAFKAMAAAGEIDTLMRHYHAALWVMAAIALLIARRVIPFFAMRAVAGLNIPMFTRAGQVQLALTLLAVAGTVAGQAEVAGVALGLAGVMALAQCWGWQPLAVRGVALLWVLYVGYALLGTGLIVAGVHALGWVERAAWGAHTVGVGGFGVLIIGMVTRTSLGHTGRALRADGRTRAAYWLMLGAALARLLALALPYWGAPAAATLGMLHLSAALWTTSFALFIAHYGPMLVRERADAARGQPLAMQPRPAR